MIKKKYKFISIMMSFIFILLLLINVIYSKEDDSYKQVDIESQFDKNINYIAPIGFHKNNPLFIIREKSDKAICIVEYYIDTKKYSVLLKQNNFSSICVSPDKSKIAYMYYNKPMNAIQLGIFNMDTKKLIKLIKTDVEIDDSNKNSFNVDEENSDWDPCASNGIKWSSGGKYVSFLKHDYGYTIPIYNADSGKMEYICDPCITGLYIGNINYYEIDDSYGMIYLTASRGDACAILYSIDYKNNSKYKILKDMSTDTILSKFTPYYNPHDFCLGSISVPNSDGFYFTSGDGRAAQLWKFTKKTGSITFINNFRSKDSSISYIPDISPDNKFFIINETQFDNAKNSVNNIYYLNNIYKKVLSCSDSGYLTNYFFMSVNNKLITTHKKLYLLK